MAQWLDFRALVRKGMAFSPHRGGTPFFAIFALYFSFLFRKIFSFSIHFWSKLRVFF